MEFNTLKKYWYQSYFEGNKLTTRVFETFDNNYGTKAEEAYKEFLNVAIQDSNINSKKRKHDSKWDGSHWQSPNVIAFEQVEDINMSEEMESFIKLLNAEYID